MEKNKIIEKDLEKSIADAFSEMQDYHASNNVSIVKNHQKILDKITAMEFSKLQKMFNTSLKNQCRSIIFTWIYLRNFICLSGHQGKKLGALFVRFASTVSIFFCL